MVGPKGFTNTNKEMSVKVGGLWRFTMHVPDGVDYPNKILYTEVIKNEKLAFVNSDEDGGNRFSTVISFERDAKKTKIQLKMSFATKEECDKVVKEYGAIECNKQTFDKLYAYLAKTK